MLFMSRSDHSATYRAIIAAVSEDDLQILDQFLSPDLVDHNASSREAAGIDGFKSWARSARGAFPDLSGSVEDLVTDGDRVAGRVTWRGRHLGDLVGLPATGKTVEFPAFHIVRFSKGKAVEWWGTADLLGVLIELGGQVRPAPCEP